MQVHTGELIDGRYEIIGTLGSGGFGAVFKARHRLLDRIVALKILNDELTAGSEAEARFEREALLISSLLHRNLVRFYGYGVWNSAPYMVMEYLQGTSLEEYLGSSALPLPRALDLIKQVCEGLACAHANGVVHRDLKPGNIMVIENEDGHETIKIIDFGLAKTLSRFGPSSQKLTAEGFAVGSVLYMSPEQCLGKSVDNRTDIYALGCTLHAALTGSSPFTDQHSVVVMHKQVAEAPVALDQSRPDLEFPSGLQNILNKSMAKDPDDRYQTVEEFRHDIELIEQGRTHEISAKHAVTPPADRSVSTKKWQSIAVLVSVFVLLGIITYTFSLWQNNRHSTLSSALFQITRDNYDRRESGTTLAEVNTKWKEVIESDRRDGALHPFQRAWALHRLADLALTAKRYDESANYACLSLDNWKQISTMRNNSTFATIKILADACHRTAHPYRALPYVKRTETIENDLCSPGSIEHGMSGMMLNYLDCGKLTDALRIARHLNWTPEKLLPRQMLDLVYGESDYANGDYEKAEIRLKRARAAGICCDRTYADLYRSKIASGNFDPVKLQASFELIARDNFIDPERVSGLRAVMAAHTGNWAEATRSFNDAVQQIRKNPELYTVSGFNYDVPLLENVCASKGRLDFAKQVEQENRELHTLLKEQIEDGSTDRWARN
jgi:serine/threonine protein kinase